jgi:hypothetical protein
MRPVLEICSIAQHLMPGSPEGAGMIFLRGVIRDHAWRIAEAYPAIDGGTLLAMLKFVAEAERDPVKAIGAFAERFSTQWPTVKITTAPT